MKSAEVIQLQRRPGGVGGGITTSMRRGRWEISTSGNDPNLQLVGGDPWGTPVFSGLIVPTAPTPFFQNRYLFMLAHYAVGRTERVKIAGLRQYASLFGFDDSGNLFEKQILTPMWRFPDGNISWHVRVRPPEFRDVRNPLNADSLQFQDSVSPALLYQTLAPYTPPNAGRPWGRPVGSDLGNMHDMRYAWNNPTVDQLTLDVPIPPGQDVLFYCSVAQHRVAAPPTLTSNRFTAANPEDQFWTAFTNVQYGRVAGSLILEADYGDEP